MTPENFKSLDVIWCVLVNDGGNFTIVPTCKFVKVKRPLSKFWRHSLFMSPDVLLKIC